MMEKNDFSHTLLSLPNSTTSALEKECIVKHPRNKLLLSARSSFLTPALKITKKVNSICKAKFVFVVIINPPSTAVPLVKPIAGRVKIVQDYVLFSEWS
jgi:hypothetical protein